MVYDKEVGNLFGDNSDGGGQGRRLTFQAWTWEADLASTQLTTAYSVAWGVGVISMMSMVLVMMEEENDDLHSKPGHGKPI